MKNLIMNSIAENVKERLGDGYDVITKDVVKNNGIVLRGLIIQKNGTHTAPNIYLNDFADDYTKGIPLEKIVEKILRIYHSFKNPDFDASCFTDFQKAKSRIVYEIINTAKNAELLKDIPSIPYLDLSIIFKVMVNSFLKNETATITIHNSHLELWNVSKEEIYSLAKENTPKIMPAKLKNMDEIIEELLPSENIMAGSPLYVLSNHINIHGSCCILYPDILSTFARMVGDFFILPSSIHEVILLPANLAGNVRELSQMVQEININEVSDEEVLSDSVYFYSKETQKLSII